jgi:26S proteasome regulatory subunit N6
MILDHKFHGILDQGKGQLIVYDSPTEDVRARLRICLPLHGLAQLSYHTIAVVAAGFAQKTYTSGLGVIENVGNIVDNLFRRADKLQA